MLGVSPILAPLASSALLALAGWRSIFWTLAAFSLALLALVAFSLTETAPRARFRAGEHASAPASLARNFVFLLSERRYLAYMSVNCITLTGIYAFVSSAAFVIVDALGYSARDFSLCFAFVALGNMLGAIASSRLVMHYGMVHYGMDRMIRIGTALAFGSGAVMAALGWLRIDHLAATVLPAFVFFFAANFVFPHATAGALSPYPRISGAASSLLGFVQLASGAAASYVLGAIYDGTQRPMATAFGLAGTAALLAYLFLVYPLPAPERKE
ncbi:MAG: MFS transporter [Betaproteobacteria bacterium]|nr:MFS transporter [Betaproteobacteria bacterium]